MDSVGNWRNFVGFFFIWHFKAIIYWKWTFFCTKKKALSWLRLLRSLSRALTAETAQGSSLNKAVSFVVEPCVCGAHCACEWSLIGGSGSPPGTAHYAIHWWSLNYLFFVCPCGYFPTTWPFRRLTYVCFRDRMTSKAPGKNRMSDKSGSPDSEFKSAPLSNH